MQGKITIVSIIILSTISLLLLVNIRKNQYFEKLKLFKLYNDGVFNEYTLPYSYFFDEYFHYPKKPKDLRDHFLETQNDHDKLLTLLRDPFSTSGSNFLYVPLYSRKNKLPEGFAIISSGIDGKLNIKITDTVYIDDISDFDFYNAVLDPIQANIYLPDPSFNTLDHFFGEKDFLVSYFDGVGNYITIQREHALSSFIELIQKYQLKENLRINFRVSGIVLEIKNDLVVIQDKETKAKCKIYSGYESSFACGDSVKLICSFKGIYIESEQLIELENCIQVE